MPSTDTRIQTALTDRLKEQLPPDRVAAFVGGTHTETLSDNVVPSITPEHLEILRAQLTAGDGGELTPTTSGKTRAHAPYSSAALALNAFGGWLERETELTVGGLAGWTEPVQIEAKLQIDHGGGRANLDVLLRAPGRVLAIESKLKEYVAPHEPTTLKPVYAKPEMAELLPGGWRRVLEALNAGKLPFRHLGADQLVKHALAVNSQFPGQERTLAYVYWEPANASDFPEFQAHRQELDQLIELLGDDADPTFLIRTYDELFEEWRVSPDAVIQQHVAALVARYGGVEI